MSGISETVVYARTPATGSALEVHGVRDAVEVGLQHVAIELAADGATPRRRAHDRNGPRGEEGLQRRHDGHVVPFVHALAVLARRHDRQPDLDIALIDLSCDGEAGILEDTEHRAIRAHHVGHERLDARLRSQLRELLEQARAGPVPLELVRDCEGDLGRRGVTQADVVRERDDVLFRSLAERAGEGTPLLPVRVEHGCYELGSERRKAMKPAIRALVREAAEEREQASRVAGHGRPQPERAAVAEDDVADVFRGRGHGQSIVTAARGEIGSSYGTLLGRYLRCRPGRACVLCDRMSQRSKNFVLAGVLLVAGVSPPCSSPRA